MVFKGVAAHADGPCMSRDAAHASEGASQPSGTALRSPGTPLSAPPPGPAGSVFPGASLFSAATAAAAPSATPVAKKPPRRHGRVRTELLSCCLGEIADLSASGMRILRRSPRAPKQGARVKVKLSCLGMKIKIQGIVVWVRTEAPGLHVVGLQFANLTPELNEKLLELCAVAGVRRAIGPRDIRGAA